MKKIKICNIGWATSIHVERWLRWFAARGHEVSLITDIHKDIHGVKIIKIDDRSAHKTRLERYRELQFNFPSATLYKLNRIIRLKKMVKEMDPDIVHSHALWFPGYLGAYLGFHPFVVTVFNGDVLWKKDNLNLWEKFRTRSALKKADLVTGVSGELTGAAVRQGAGKERAYIIRRGVDRQKFNTEPDKKRTRELLGLPVHSKIVLSPRNTAPLYNLSTIIETIPQIIEKCDNTTFVFIWHEDIANNDLKVFAEQKGVSKYIKFVGKVEHDKVALYHKAADVMVSIADRDSGPIALQEAMACGAAPVISDLPSVRELVRHEYNGLLVNPHDADQVAGSVIRLLRDDKMREDFAVRNSGIVKEQCDQEKEMLKMEQLYYQLIEGKKK